MKMNIKTSLFLTILGLLLIVVVSPSSTDAAVLFSQSVLLKPGWNIVSTPRVLESYEFSAPETSANFDIFVLDASKPSGWATMADLGQSKFTPLYGYFIKNKTGVNQTLTFNYRVDVPPNERLFQRTFTATGWYSLGVANPSYAKPRGGSVTDTNNVDPILNSLLGTFSYYGTVVDFTDARFSTEPDSLALTDPWKATVRSPDVANTTEINKLNDFRETKGYAIYIKQANSLYSGFQNNDTPIPSPPEPFAADIKANDSDVPITIPHGSSATINWSSTGASSCSITPTGWMGLIGSQTTGVLTGSQTYTLTCTDGTNFVGDSVTVNLPPPASLTVSVASTPVSQTVVSGINAFTFAKIQYDGLNSGEDLRVTAQALTYTTAAAFDLDNINTCQVFDGSIALNIGGNVVNFSSNAFGADSDSKAHSFDNHLIIPKGTIKVVDVKCNISSIATTSSLQVGIAVSVDTATVVGKDTGVSVTPTVTINAGPTMTIAANGTLTVALDVSSPTQERYAIAGKTDVLLSVLKFHADNEAIKLDRIALVLSSSTASSSDLMKVTLWDGATKMGEALFQGTDTRATSTLSSAFIVPKDGDKMLTIKGDLSTLGVNQPATRGHLVAVNHDGESGATETDGIGQSSGVTINPSAGGNTAGGGVRLVKSYPTLERLSVSSNTLANGEMVLYRLKVTADAAGDVGLSRMSFRVSSTSVATTTVFKLYAYSDSSFSTAAYATNPVHTGYSSATNVSAVGTSTWGGVGTHAAPSNSVVFFFNPALTTASAADESVEALNIPAGTSRYFQLLGTFSSATAGDNVSVALLGDSAVANNTNLVGRETSDTASGATGRFIWSPNTTTTSSVDNVDWLNGYQVPGLPGTEMTPQSFTK